MLDIRKSCKTGPGRSVAPLFIIGYNCPRDGGRGRRFHTQYYSNCIRARDQMTRDNIDRPKYIYGSNQAGG